MPSGIILSSASPGATQEAIEKVLTGHGLEVDKPESEVKAAIKAAIEEPQRDAFATEEEYVEAHGEWKTAQVPPEGESDDEEEEEAPIVAKKPSKFQKRIQKITSKLEKENADLRKRLEGIEGKKEETAEPENKRPVRTAFKGDDEYEDALLQWGVDKALVAKAQKEAQQSEQAQLNENLTNYRAQVEEAKEEYEDWDEVVNQDIPMHTGVQLAIMEQENGAEVVYYLGRHPEYTKKLAEMTPLSAVMEVGRLSAKLSAESGSAGTATSRGEPTKPKPKVPAPVRPVSTAATSSTLTSADAAKARNFKAFKAAQRAGR